MNKHETGSDWRLGGGQMVNRGAVNSTRKFVDALLGAEARALAN